MTPERIARLEELPGWVWNAKVRPDPGWHEHFRCLEQFVAREGHPRVPGHHVEDGRKLGVWVSNQRAEYRQQKTSMTPERIARLEAVPGWSWNLRAQAWEDGLSRLVAFIDRYGHTRVPRKHVEEDGYRLGQWVYEQEKLYRSGKLAEDRALRLASVPGWRWSAGEQNQAPSESVVSRDSG
jgi:hypothetical protein